MDARKIVRDCIKPKPWRLIVGATGCALGILLILVDARDSSVSSFFGATMLLMTLSLLLLLGGLLNELPSVFGTRRTLKRLEESGDLETAARELESGHVRLLCKNNVICTEHFLFVRKSAIACPYTDILWAYKERLVRRVLFIPYQTLESAALYLAKDYVSINVGGKDKQNEIVTLLTDIHRRNPNVLIGYTPENRKAYEQKRAEWRASIRS